MADILTLKRLNSSLAGKIRQEAKRRGVAADPVRKQYTFTLFLSRMFGGKAEPAWVLLGGNALMIRTGGGRFTEDIDLARGEVWDDLEAVRLELQSLADQNPERDPFTFEIYAIEPHSEADPFGYGAKTAKAKVRVLLDTEVFDNFSIDITARRHIDGPVDLVPLRAVIAHETLKDLPAVPTTPAENHLADKVCAMYELHGSDKTTPSTRYRDLADIVRLTRGAALNALRLIDVLQREAGRRQMTLPASLVAPAPEWEDGFPRAARDFAEYPTELYSLQASLDAAAPCLDAILSGSLATGIWDPITGQWSTSGADATDET